MSKNILVTGGCGFIGSTLCAKLVADGVSVTVIDDLSSGDATRLPQAASLIRADILDAETMKAAIARADAVVHLAAVASVQVCQTDPYRSHLVNQSAFVGMLAAIAEEGRKGRHVPVVYASSAAVYGDTGEAGAVSENAPTLPISNYGADKLGLELQAHAGRHMWGVSSIGLRFFNVYGPGQKPDSPYAGVISRFLADLTQTGRIRVFGDGKQSRDFIHVDDIVIGIIAALKVAPGRCESLNLCTGRETNLIDLYSALSDILGVTPVVDWQPPRTGDIRRSLGDGCRAKSLLAFSADIDLKRGLTSLLNATDR